MDLATISDELYAALPDEFTRARNAASKEAKADGDADLSAAIAKLSKPAAAAWVINMLVRHRADAIHDVLILGEALRAAQEGLAADQMRELTRQRRRLTEEVTRQGQALAAELGHPVSRAITEQVQGTLHAAMVDAGAAEALQGGRLSQPLSATGFGTVDVSSAITAGPPSTPVRSARPDLAVVPDDTTASDAATELVETAGAALEEAEQRAKAATAQAEELSARYRDAKVRLEELQRRVDESERELGELTQEHRAAEREQQATDEHLVEARHTVASARADLAALTST